MRCGLDGSKVEGCLSVCRFIEVIGVICMHVQGVL